MFKFEVKTKWHPSKNDNVTFWCTTNIGKFEIDWNIIFYESIYKDGNTLETVIFQFRKYEDYIMFILRWC